MSSSSSSAVVGVRKGAWTPEEDLLLKKCIHKFGEGKWHQVPIRAGLNRCRKSCRLRWMNYLKPDIKRGEFTSDEVDIIIRMHKLLGNRWSLIAGRIPGRTANDIKNYWNTHLKQKRPPSQSRNKKVIIMKELADQSDDHDHQATKIKALRPQPRAFASNCQWLLSRIRSRVEKLPFTDHHQEAPSKQSKELDFPQVAEEGSPWWETILFIDDEENARNGCGSQSSMEEEELMITKYNSIIDAMEPERCNEENPLMEEGKKSDWGNLFLDLGLWDLMEPEN